MAATETESLLLIGWREWIALPDLSVPAIKAKTDTGARTSALHAESIQRFSSGGAPRVSFTVHPSQRDRDLLVQCEAEMIDEREIRSSHGDTQLRPVIRTAIEIKGIRWDIEITLTRRDSMGFRMLLGRQAMRGHCLVDPRRSYVGNPKPRRRKSKKSAEQGP